MAGFVVSLNLKIGDLDRGAPELRANSRYNLDDKFVTSHYSISADVLVVMVETPDQMCSSYAALESIDRLHWTLENVSGVQSVLSLVTAVKRIQSGFNEGNLKWATLVADDAVLNESAKNVPELYNSACSLVPVFVFLDDHKAETLTRVTQAVEAFARENDTNDTKFLLASGNAGIEAATNDVISASKTPMLLLVYGVVIVLCLIAFRSWRPVVCIILPLVLIDYMAAGCAAIGSDAAGVNDVIEPGVNGWKFPRGDDAALAATLAGVLAGELGVEPDRRAARLCITELEPEEVEDLSDRRTLPRMLNGTDECQAGQAERQDHGAGHRRSSNHRRPPLVIERTSQPPPRHGHWERRSPRLPHRVGAFRFRPSRLNTRCRLEIRWLRLRHALIPPLMWCARSIICRATRLPRDRC